MARLIDADALKKENERLLHCDFPYLSETTLEELIDEAPTIDAEPVRHGKWIHRGCGIFACSKCGKDVGLNVYTSEKASETFKWCPHCGARMDEE